MVILKPVLKKMLTIADSQVIQARRKACIQRVNLRVQTMSATSQLSVFSAFQLTTEAVKMVMAFGITGASGNTLSQRPK